MFRDVVFFTDPQMAILFFATFIGYQPSGDFEKIFRGQYCSIVPFNGIKICL